MTYLRLKYGKILALFYFFPQSVVPLNTFENNKEFWTLWECKLETLDSSTAMYVQYRWTLNSSNCAIYQIPWQQTF